MRDTKDYKAKLIQVVVGGALAYVGFKVGCKLGIKHGVNVGVVGLSLAEKYMPEEATKLVDDAAKEIGPKAYSVLESGVRFMAKK